MLGMIIFVAVVLASGFAVYFLLKKAFKLTLLLLSFGVAFAALKYLFGVI